MSDGRGIGVGFALAGLGIVAFYIGYQQYSLKKKIEYTPTSKAVSVTPGLAEVYGTTRPFKNTFTSPFGRQQCVYYSTELYKWYRSGKHKHSELVKRLESPDPILLEDETGTVIVKPWPGSPAIKTDLEAKKKLGRGALSTLLLGEKKTDPNDPMYRFVAENAPELLNYGDDLEVNETFIREGDKLYVLGTAEIFDPGEPQPRIIVRPHYHNFFCISEYSEKETLDRISSSSYLYALGGPLLFLLGCGIVTSYLFNSSPAAGLALAAAAFITLVMYLFLLWVWLLEFYNGLVLLKNQIGRAKANIDAFLVKRHALIPNLVKVVGAYAKYEKDMQVNLAEIRSAKVGESEKNLIAISEAYPKLKANENFIALQKELVKIENQIAGSRNYYNDSVLFYNQRIGSFPYLIIAKITGLKQAQYLNLGD